MSFAIKLFMTFFFAIIFFSQAQAQRKVGNGGGLAEMKMIYIDENLGLYIDTCLKDHSFCKMDGGLMARLSDLKEKMTRNPILKRISFETGESGSGPVKITPNWNGPVLIDSRMIYENDEPIQFSKMLSLAAAVRLFQSHPEISFEEYFQSSISAFINFSESSTKTTNLGHNLKLHVFRFSLGGAQHRTLLAIEDSVKTLSLDRKLASCCGLDLALDIRIGNIRFQEGSTGNHILADLEWDFESKLLVISFLKSAEGIIDSSSIFITTRAN